MKPEDRPFILFRRVVNKGLSPRKETVKKDGTVSRPAHPGEFTEEWTKSLVSHRAPHEPYCWVSKDWILCRVHADCVPIGFGNMDKLPSDYPKEWRERLEETIGTIAGSVQANQKLAQIQIENERLKALLASKEVTDEAAENSASGEQAEVSGRDAAPVQKPSRAARQAAVAA